MNSAKLVLEDVKVQFPERWKHKIALELRVVDNVATKDRAASSLTRKWEPNGGKELLWNVISDPSPFSFHCASNLCLNVTEIKSFAFKKQLAKFVFNGATVEREHGEKSGAQLETSLTDTKSNITVSIKFQKPQLASSPAKGALDKASKATENHKSALDRLGSVRAVVDTVFKVASIASDFHPLAKTALSGITLAYECLQRQKQCDDLVVDLVDAMTRVLPFIKVTEEEIRLDVLKDAIVEMLELIEQASQFIVEYTGDGASVRILKSVVSSNARDQVDDFTKKLTTVSTDFDRAVSAEIRNTVQTAEERELLNTLNPVRSSRYDPERGCMDGTRKEILHDFEEWSRESSNPQKLIWLYGMAGLGKSAIASTLCQRLDALGQLGASFFCRRDDPNLNDPKCVVPTLLYRLANAWAPFRKAMVNQLRSQPELSSAPPGQQFESLFASPLRKLQQAPPRTLIILVDALDECGIPATRRVVIDVLYRISLQVPWLKVIVTGRHERDIQQVYEKFDKSYVLSRDLLAESEASSDVLLFAGNKMSTIAKNHSLHQNWPGEILLSKIGEMANGLFIWVQTVALFVDDSLDPVATLKLVLKGKSTSDAYVSLHELYKTALEVGVGEGEDNARMFRLVLGGVLAVATRRPLPDQTLRPLLANQMTQRELSGLVDRLSSLLYRDLNDGVSIRIHHLSFIDFVTNKSPSRICPDRFLINLDAANAHIAGACVRTMKANLKFNICALEQSNLPNSEVPDLQVRIQESISAPLQYSCIYWHSHLSHTPQDDVTVLRLLGDFVSGSRVLWWLEALSLTGEIKTAVTGLPQVLTWIKEKESRIAHFLYDIHRFVLSNQQAMSYSAPHIYLSALPFSPQSSLLVTQVSDYYSSNGLVTRGRELTWDRCVQVFTTAYPVHDVFVTPDGHTVISCSNEGFIELRNSLTGVMIGRPIETTKYRFHTAALSRDGALLAYEIPNYCIQIWDIELGTIVGEPMVGHTGAIESLAFSSDGHYLASGSSIRDISIRLWSIDSGESVGNPLRNGDWRNVDNLAYVRIAGELHLLSGHYTEICLWRVEDDPEAPDLVRRIEIPSTFGEFVVSPNDMFIVVGSSGVPENALQLYDLQSIHPIGKVLEGSDQSSSYPVWSPDSKLLALGKNTGEIALWDVHERTLIGVFAGHIGQVTFSVAFTPDGRSIISGSDDGTIRTWALVDEVGIMGSEDEIKLPVIEGLQYSMDGQILASLATNTVYTWNGESGTPHHLKVASPPAQFCYAFISPLNPSAMTTVSADGKFSTWELATGNSMDAWVTPFPPGVMKWSRFSHSSREYRIAVAALSSVCIWDLKLKKQLGDPLIHKGFIYALSLTEDGTQVVTLAQDGLLRIWNLESQTLVNRPLRVAQCDSLAGSAAIMPEKRLVAFNDTKSAYICAWNEEGMTTPVCISRRAICFSFSPNGQFIACGLKDGELGEVAIWDIGQRRLVGECLTGHQMLVRALAWSPDSRRIASGSGDASIRIWDVEAECKKMPLPGDYWAKVTVGEDGWLRNEHGLVLWVPKGYRHAVFDRSLWSIPRSGPSRTIKLDWSCIPDSDSWTTVQRLKS